MLPPLHRLRIHRRQFKFDAGADLVEPGLDRQEIIGKQARCTKLPRRYRGGAELALRFARVELRKDNRRFVESHALIEPSQRGAAPKLGVAATALANKPVETAVPGNPDRAAHRPVDSVRIERCIGDLCRAAAEVDALERLGGRDGIGKRPAEPFERLLDRLDIDQEGENDGGRKRQSEQASAPGRSPDRLRPDDRVIVVPRRPLRKPSLSAPALAYLVECPVDFGCSCGIAAANVRMILLDQPSVRGLDRRGIGAGLKSKRPVSGCVGRHCRTLMQRDAARKRMRWQVSARGEKWRE